MIRSAFGSDENGQLNGFPNIPNKIFMEEVFFFSAPFPFSLNCFSLFRFVILGSCGFVNSSVSYFQEFKNWEDFGEFRLNILVFPCCGKRKIRRKFTVWLSVATLWDWVVGFASIL